MIYTFTAAAAYATAAAAYADMVKLRLSTALALFSWGLAELGNITCTWYFWWLMGYK